MTLSEKIDWREKLVSPREALMKIQPGMTIFIGTGPAAPLTLMKTLLESDENNVRDIELIQLAIL
jgi:acyl-CoA hydrolase